MKNIRKSVFETNSSSTHSISIAKDNKDGIYDTITPTDDGYIVLTGGEFGWEWKKYTDPLTKANYCAVDSFNISKRMKMLFEVLKEHTGAKRVIIDFNNSIFDDSNRFDHSYVDHQSHGTSSKAFKSKKTLKEFIFNPNSILMTGNDNSGPPIYFYNNKENSKYSIKINGINTINYLNKKDDYDEIYDAIEQIFDIKNLYGYNYGDGWVEKMVDIEKEEIRIKEHTWSNGGKDKIKIIAEYTYSINEINK